MKLTLTLLLSGICGIAALPLSAHNIRESSAPILLADWEFSKSAPDAPEQRWEKVRVPHCWNATDAQQGGGKEDNKTWGFYRGPGTYKTSFTSPLASGKSDHLVFLKFGAVSNAAKVYLNGNLLGEHLGAFGSFGFDVTSMLSGKDNQLVVAASNAFRKDILPISGDFPVYGGMYRPVSLIVKPKVCISPIANGSYGIRTFQHGVGKQSATLDSSTVIYNATDATQQGAFAITLKDHTGKVIVSDVKKIELKPGGNDVTATLKVSSPHLWNGRKDPYLYKLTAAIKTEGTAPDAVTVNIGFRNVEFDAEKGLFLNGQHIDGYGVCLHQDWKDVGWALTSEQHKINADLIEEIGATVVRLAHYPHAEEMLDECDRRGIMVWSEIPFVDSIGKPKVDGVEQVTKQQLVEMIRQQINHPCVITWGLSNELKHRPTDDPLPLMRELNDLAHQEDPTRKTTCAVNRIGDKDLCTITDLLGLNSYPGWYGGGPERMQGTLEDLHKRYPNSPASISEYGSGASIRQHDRNITKTPSTTGKWHPEEYQSRAHEINWEKISQHKAHWATFIWNLCDFASVWRDEGDASGINDKGLVTFDRKVKKDAFYFYKANWRTDIPVLHIQEKRATPTKDEEVKIRFYSNMQDHVVTLNGTEIKDIKKYALNAYETAPVKLSNGKNTVKVSARGKTSQSKTISDQAVWEKE